MFSSQYTIRRYGKADQDGCCLLYTSCIPQTILFGRSPAGENATGESDLENYYNFVEGIQKRMLKKNIRTLIKAIVQAGVYDGSIENPGNIKPTFKPLWSLSETEKATVELSLIHIYMCIRDRRKGVYTVRVFLASTGQGMSRETRDEAFRKYQPRYVLETFFNGEKACLKAMQAVGNDNFLLDSGAFSLSLIHI